MLERDVIVKRHDGCPNRHHCSFDESKCCFLVKQHCIIGEKEKMNLDNRRLKEIQAEKLVWQDQLSKCETISDCLAFQCKIDILEEEEKQILKRCDVNV